MSEKIDGKLEELVTSWRSMLERLEQQVMHLRANQMFFQKVNEIIKNNPEVGKPGDFVEWLTNQYVDSTLMRARRLVDRCPESISLWRLYREIETNCALLTRAWFLSKYDEEFTADEGAELFRVWQCGCGCHVDPGVIIRHRLELEENWGRLKKWVDRRIAHKSEKNVDYTPKFRDLDAVIEGIEDKTRQLRRLLTAGEYPTYSPTWQYDWTGPLRIPWLPPRASRAER